MYCTVTRNDTENGGEIFFAGTFSQWNDAHHRGFKTIGQVTIFGQCCTGVQETVRLFFTRTIFAHE